MRPHLVEENSAYASSVLLVSLPDFNHISLIDQARQRKLTTIMTKGLYEQLLAC